MRAQTRSRYLVVALAPALVLAPVTSFAQGAKPASPPVVAKPPAPAPTPRVPVPAKPPAKPVAAPVAPAAPAKPAPAAPPAATSTAKATALELDVRQAKLDNGLRVVMAPDHTAPTVAIDVVYDVGGRNEERGHSGFAHLFEHMMFQGSANVPRGEHFKLVSGHGGTLNGTTNSDRTNYFEMMPQSELALALWLEADRMKSLDISQKNFENQRAVVKEEYRMRVENVPYVPAEIRLSEMVFQGYWPYEHSAIGSMRDLDAAQLEWVRAFHDAYYAPNNAVVSIAGDFEPDQALELVKKYFGHARPLAQLSKYEPGAMPEQTQPRDAVVEDAHAKLPGILWGWAIPQNRDPDHYALELAAMLLSDGESSRLYKSLVREKSVAIEVEAGAEGHRGPDMFEVSAKLAGGAKVADVEKMMAQAISDVAKNGPSDAEMQKLQNRIQAKFLLGLQSNFARAQKLAEMELYFGDAKLLNTELSRYLAVTKADIKRVVGKYLTPARRSRIEVKPAATSTAAPAAPAAPAAAAAPTAPAAPKPAKK